MTDHLYIGDVRESPFEPDIKFQDISFYDEKEIRIEAEYHETKIRYLFFYGKDTDPFECHIQDWQGNITGIEFFDTP